MYIGLHVKYPLFLSDFNQTGIFLKCFRKIAKYKSRENSYRGSRVFVRGQTGGWTDITELIVTFRNFANARKLSTFCPRSVFNVFCMCLTISSYYFPIRYKLTGLSWRFKSSGKWGCVEQTLILRTLCSLWRRNCSIIRDRNYERVAMSSISFTTMTIYYLPIILYGREIWALRKKNKKRSTSIEKKIFRRTARYTHCDHKRNEEILEEMKVEPVDEKLRSYKSNWLRHLTGTNNNTMPEIILNYRPNGQRRLGTPLKRLLD